MTEEEETKKQLKKLKQAEAHRKWRQGPKYLEYKARQKAKKEAKNDPSSQSA